MCEWSVPDWGGAPAPSPPPDHLYSPPNTLVRCELQSDPLWAKMSSNGANSKKRKKPETKPQSQLAKSLNEKRRRELENIFIEELAELISTSFTDMSSLAVKPDKCAILQETVNQIRRIKEREAAATIDAIQQGEVSSSKPTILTSEVFGPLLLEALEGFLFVVNHEGKVEYVTDGISSFIKFSKDEVLGKPVYNIIHHGDHGRFTSALHPTVWSLEGSSSTVASGGGSTSNSLPRNRIFNCRFLIKPPDDSNQTVEEKQQRISKYESMQVIQINSSQIAELTGGEKDEDGNDIGPCLMCVARRIMPSEKHTGTSMEQFTMKLDPSGKIMGIDMTGLSTGFTQIISKKDLVGRNLEDIVHSADHSKVSGHLKDVQSQTQGISPIYRIKVTVPSSVEKYIHVQTKSKFFKSISEPDFIMSTHSIIAAGGEEPMFFMGEANSPNPLGGQGSSCGMGQQMILSSSGSVNGATARSETTTSSVSSSELANTINSLSNTSNFNTVSITQGLTSNDLSYDINFVDMFPSSTWGELSERSWERSESRTSLTPAPSPLAPAPATPSFSTSNFPFSPPVLDDSKETSNDTSSGNGNNPCRLRNLLTEGLSSIKRESTDSESGGGGGGGGGSGSQDHGGGSNEKNKYILLTKILNEKDEDQQGSSHHPDQSPHNKSKNKNDMLLQLLNKSEDDDIQQKGGTTDDILLNNLGLGSLTATQAETIRRGTKRPSSEENQGLGSGCNTPQSADDGPNLAKRPANPLLDTLPPSGSVSSSVKSKLWESNRMLASLLANPPSTPTTIPPIPASVISATPQDKLPRVIKNNNPQNSWSGCNVQQGSGIPQSPGSQGAGSNSQNVPTGRPGAGSALQSAITSPDYRWTGDESSSDPYLSHILDQVIEIAPEDSPALANIINSIEANSIGALSGVSFQQDIMNEKINERLAINAIQKSLMQCETLQQKTPVYSVSQQLANAQGQQQQQFPPPPVYQQTRQRLSLSGLRQGQFTLGTQQQQQLLLQQQRNKILQQQQTKQRLLQLQQHQQLLIPSNAAASTGDPTGIHNIDTLMNNTVAPNVSLQRSASVPDSQLSPVGSYSNSGNNTPNLINSGNSQISPSQRQPFSPQPFSPVNGGMNSFQTSGGNNGSTTPNPSGPVATSQGAQQARMSPSSLQGFQQAQLSPRLSQGQTAYAQSQSTSWSQQQANRISLQQQQNPMLNAQLTGGNYNANSGRNFNPGTPPGAGGGTPPSSTAGNTGRVGLPPVRSLTSPGSRQSPFPPELSPTAAGSATNYQFRIQRTLSGGPAHQSVVAPQATTHLPGGPLGGSGCGRMYKEQVPYHHNYHPPHVNPHQHPQHPLLYQQSHPASDQGYPGKGYPDGYRQHHTGGNNGVTEYVKHEIRAMVGARTGSAGMRGAGGGGQQSQQIGLSAHHLDTLGFAIELQPQGVGDSQKIWNNLSDMGASSPQSASLQSRSSLDDVNRSNDQKSSLLQKLLSE